MTPTDSPHWCRLGLLYDGKLTGVARGSVMPGYGTLVACCDSCDPVPGPGHTCGMYYVADFTLLRTFATMAGVPHRARVYMRVEPVGPVYPDPTYKVQGAAWAGRAWRAGTLKVLAVGHHPGVGAADLEELHRIGAPVNPWPRRFTRSETYMAPVPWGLALGVRRIPVS